MPFSNRNKRNTYHRLNRLKRKYETAKDFVKWYEQQQQQSKDKFTLISYKTLKRLNPDFRSTYKTRDPIETELDLMGETSKWIAICIHKEAPIDISFIDHTIKLVMAKEEEVVSKCNLDPLYIVEDLQLQTADKFFRVYERIMIPCDCIPKLGINLHG